MPMMPSALPCRTGALLGAVLVLAASAMTGGCDREDARRRAVHVVDLCREFDDPIGHCDALVLLSCVAFDTGKFDLARTHLCEAEASARQAADPSRVDQARVVHCFYLTVGELGEAELHGVPVAIKDLFDKAARSATTETPARVRYTDLHGAISRLVVHIHIVRLRVTVTHTRDGLVEELDGEDGEATIGPREQAIPRKPRLRIEGGDG